MRTSAGTMRPFADVPSIDELAAHGGDVVLTSEPKIILQDMFQVSGEIPRITSFERGLPGQYPRTLDDRDWEPDPLLMDERSVSAHVARKGLIVFSACSHARIINVLNHARTQFSGIPIHCVMGGVNLSGENEKIIPDTIEALKAFNIATIAAGHCTGWRPITALAATFGTSVVPPIAVGKRFTFELSA